ncbi:hypothetical protein Tco_1052305 [Tanacetum coccineum]
MLLKGSELGAIMARVPVGRNGTCQVEHAALPLFGKAARIYTRCSARSLHFSHASQQTHSSSTSGSTVNPTTSDACTSRACLDPELIEAYP